MNDTLSENRHENLSALSRTDTSPGECMNIYRVHGNSTQFRLVLRVLVSIAAPSTADFRQNRKSLVKCHFVSRRAAST